VTSTGTSVLFSDTAVPPFDLTSNFS
jgi:hypothetical protein